jgi:hypothetical protein
MAALAAPVRLAATPSGSLGSAEGTGGTQAGVVPDEALAFDAVVAAPLDAALVLDADELAELELDELLPHAVSTQAVTANAPSARMGRHPITRISTSLDR